MNKRIMTMFPEDANMTSGGGEQKQEQQTQQEVQTNLETKTEQHVPYTRFKEINDKYRDIESKYSRLQETLEKMKGALTPNEQKRFKLDYSNPEKSIEDFMKSTIEERIKELEAKHAEREKSYTKDAAIKWFRSQPDYTPELEEKAAKIITEKGLNALPHDKAVEIAYQLATIGDGSGYVRKQKEGLAKPNGGAKDKEIDILTEISNLDPNDEKYEEKMKALHSKLMQK